MRTLEPDILSWNPNSANDSLNDPNLNFSIRKISILLVSTSWFCVGLDGLKYTYNTAWHNGKHHVNVNCYYYSYKDSHVRTVSIMQELTNLVRAPSQCSKKAAKFFHATVHIENDKCLFSKGVKGRGSDHLRAEDINLSAMCNPLVTCNGSQQSGFKALYQAHQN